MPRSKKSWLIENTKLADKREFAAMDRSELKLQFRIREKLLQQMVGTCVEGIVVDEMHILEECLLDPGYQKLPFPEKESQNAG